MRVSETRSQCQGERRMMYLMGKAGVSIIDVPRTGLCVLLCLLSGCLLPARAWSQEEIELLFDDRTPYSEPQLNVASSEVAIRAAHALNYAGIPMHWRKLPSQHQLLAIKTNHQRQCGIDWYKTAEREKFARYSAPLRQDSPYVAVTRNHDPRFPTIVTLTQLQDSKLLLAASTNLSFGKELDRLIRDQHLQVIESRGGDSELVSMVISGHADYALVLKEDIIGIISSLGSRARELETHSVSGFPEPDWVYLMCSKRVDTVTMAAINAGIAKVLAEIKTEP